jgi:pyruvate kinase
LSIGNPCDVSFGRRHGVDANPGPWSSGDDARVATFPHRGGGPIPYRPTTLLKRRRTKIVATLGPASSDAATIRRLIEAGVDVFRMNMSHGDHAGHDAAFKRVRAAADEAEQPVALLADLCGPKIRVGQLEKGEITLTPGESAVVTTRDVLGGPGLIPSQYKALARDVEPGCRILLDDGRLELRVDGVQDSEIACTVVHGGVLKDRKGMNLPDVDVSAPSLTDKDRADAAFAIDLGVDFLALSFVRRAADVADLRALIPDAAGTRIVAKIEKPEALDNIDEILDVADLIMVARGDLGVELPPEAVPVAQRELLAKAHAHHTATIVATQMLESMIDNPQPTRAEVSDVANAVFSGADAVMLSAETATGHYPERAVEMMDHVARQSEHYLFGQALTLASQPSGDVTLPVAISRSTAQLASDLAVRAIMVFSRDGATAEVVSAGRPSAPVVAATTDPATWRRMNILWGVVPILVRQDELTDLPALARRLNGVLGLAEPGQYLLMLSGFGRTEAERAPSITVLIA